MDIRGQRGPMPFLIPRILYNNNWMLFRKQLLFLPKLLLYILAAIFTQCVPDCAFWKLCILKRWNNSLTFPQAVNKSWGYYLSLVGNNSGMSIYAHNSRQIIVQCYFKAWKTSETEISFSMVFVTSLWDYQWLTKLMAHSQGPIFQSSRTAWGASHLRLSLTMLLGQDVPHLRWERTWGTSQQGCKTSFIPSWFSSNFLDHF